MERAINSNCIYHPEQKLHSFTIYFRHSEKDEKSEITTAVKQSDKMFAFRS